MVWPEAGLGNFSGSGNKGPLSFLRLLSLKKVVVVEMVCVVVVLAKTWWSPELSSDREDSESLVTGMASDDVDSSPYAGGAIARRPVLGRGSRSKDVVFLGSPVCDEAASPSEG